MKAEKILQDYGIKTRNSDNSFRNFLDVLEEIYYTWSKQELNDFMNTLLEYDINEGDPFDERNI